MASDSAVKTFRASEVAAHKDKSNPWLIIHDQVYDVSKFLDEHPGGEEVLLEQAGKDATENFEDVGHSSDARDLMKQYLIGELAEEDKAKQKVKEQNWSKPAYSSEGDNSSGWKSWVLPFAIGLAATMLYRYYLSYAATPASASSQ